MVILCIDVLVIEESSPNVILVSKARRQRLLTGNWNQHARHEEWDPSIPDVFRRFLVRPLQLFMTPICFLMALYGSFAYGILYL